MRFSSKLKTSFACVLLCAALMQAVPASAQSGGGTASDASLDTYQDQIDSYSDKELYSAYLEKYRNAEYSSLSE